MLIAAYQAPLSLTRSADIISELAEQVVLCEARGVQILCCPEGVLGGLADYVEPPDRLVFAADGVELTRALAPLRSASVATIIGYTEYDAAGRLFNSAAVFYRGVIVGRYRKLHPAIRRSVYTAGREAPVFTVGSLTFGILLCRDSTFPEPARLMVAQGAKALFIPTNNGLPVDRPHPEIVAESRRIDVARAAQSAVFVIRADVAGTGFGLHSHGSTAVVGPKGQVVAEAQPLKADLVIAAVSHEPAYV